MDSLMCLNSLNDSQNAHLFEQINASPTIDFDADGVPGQTAILTSIASNYR